MVVDAVPLAEAAVREYLAEWFDHYHLALFRYFVRLLGDEEQAADILQETFARTQVALRTQALPSYPYAWLCRIGGNLVIDMLRRNRRWRWLPFQTSTPSHDHAVATAQDVRDCLVRINRREAELLILAHCVGLSPSEIAAILGENVSTVRVRLHRARHHFRDQYTKEDGS
ncbi:RNA polymerase sigma factor [Herpetosiphon gulosus]|uniref:RNA polymerase sigma factor SigV n=1 Tax=Herpetosiphon gulosus TaxID=1973496 RepID=A0ABP9X425_9CHLR